METGTPEVKKMSLAELQAMVLELQTQLAEVKKSVEPKNNKSQREMTDEDARRILFGDLATEKHGKVASTLGLSYGQVYSCRLEYTFKNIHKEMKEKGLKNSWVK